MTQPEALRLAELLEERSHDALDFLPTKTAAELRRLHEQNQRFYAQHASVVSDYEKAVVALKAQRDALLEACKVALGIVWFGKEYDQIAAAIKQAEENK